MRHRESLPKDGRPHEASTEPNIRPLNAVYWQGWLMPIWAAPWFRRAYGRRPYLVALLVGGASFLVVFLFQTDRYSHVAPWHWIAFVMVVTTGMLPVSQTQRK